MIYELKGVGLMEPPKTTLGIRAVHFAHEGNVTAELDDGTRVPISIPTGWEMQAIHSVIVWRCTACRSFVLGVPRCNRCHGRSDGAGPEQQERGSQP